MQQKPPDEDLDAAFYDAMSEAHAEMEAAEGGPSKPLAEMTRAELVDEAARAMLESDALLLCHLATMPNSPTATAMMRALVARYFFPAGLKAGVVVSTPKGAKAGG